MAKCRQVQNANTVYKRNGTLLSYVSNCKTAHPYRMRVLNQLKYLLKKDMLWLGKCGADGNKRKGKDFSNDGFRKIYNFFASFENSICPYYISEKLFKPIQDLQIPVVGGNSRNVYEEYLPGSAFLPVVDD